MLWDEAGPRAPKTEPAGPHRGDAALQAEPSTGTGHPELSPQLLPLITDPSRLTFLLLVPLRAHTVLVGSERCLHKGKKKNQATSCRGPRVGVSWSSAQRRRVGSV